MLEKLQDADTLTNCGGFAVGALVEGGVEPDILGFQYWREYYWPLLLLARIWNYRRSLYYYLYKAVPPELDFLTNPESFTRLRQ